MKIEQFVEKVLHSRDQVHIWHLQTKSYAEHKALNEYYDKLLDLFDDFIETWMGAYNQRFSASKMILEFKDHNSIDVTNHMKDMKSFLENEARTVITSKNTDLNNILDELLGLVNHISYLLTLS